MDVMVEVILDCHVRTGKAVVPLYYLDIEHLCSPCEDTWKHSIEFFFFDVNLPADAEEDLDLVI